MSNISKSYGTGDNTLSISQFLNEVGKQGLKKTDAPQKTDATQTTGSGSLAGADAAPHPASVTALNAMMASISSMMPKMTGDQLDTLVTSLTTKMKDTIDASEKDNINNSQAKKEQAIKEKTAKLKEAEQKINDAIKAQHSSSIFDKIKLAFEYIGAIMAMVAGVIAIATAPLTGPLGAVAGALLITSGICMLTLAIDDTVAAATGKDGQPGMGMFGLMVKAFAKLDGKSDEEATSMGKKGEMGFKIGLMAIAIITGAVGAFINPTGAISAVEETADAAVEIDGAVNMGMDMANAGEGIADATELADGAGEMTTVANEGVEVADSVEEAASGIEQAATMAERLSKNADRIGKVIKIVENTQTIASAGAQIGSSVETYKASDAQADAKRAQADAKQFEALGKFLDDMVDMAISRLKNNGDRFNQILDSVTEAMHDRADTMSHAKFRA